MNLLHRIRRILVWSALEKPKSLASGAPPRLHARKPPRKLRRRKPSERDRSFTSDPFTDAIILIDRVPGRTVVRRPCRRIGAQKKFHADLLSPRNENVISWETYSEGIIPTRKVERAFSNSELIPCNSFPVFFSLNRVARARANKLVIKILLTISRSRVFLRWLDTNTFWKNFSWRGNISSRYIYLNVFLDPLIRLSFVSRVAAQIVL